MYKGARYYAQDLILYYLPLNILLQIYVLAQCCLKTSGTKTLNWMVLEAMTPHSA